jgi:hypothetical protein
VASSERCASEFVPQQIVEPETTEQHGLQQPHCVRFEADAISSTARLLGGLERYAQSPENLQNRYGKQRQLPAAAQQPGTECIDKASRT